MKPAMVWRMNCGLNGPPARAPLVTMVLKKLPFQKVPRAELSDPLNRPARYEIIDEGSEPAVPDVADDNVDCRDDNVDCTVPVGVSAA